MKARRNGLGSGEGSYIRTMPSREHNVPSALGSTVNSCYDKRRSRWASRHGQIREWGGPAVRVPCKVAIRIAS